MINTPTRTGTDHEHDQEELRDKALSYHASPVPGKMSVHLSKPTETSLDLALAYSPGVAEPCREIFRDPATAYTYTGKGNLVGVLTNGTAILGLGNLGPLASKPVMEGKGVLFKKFGGIDCYDVEIDSTDPEEFIKIAHKISVTFGGINLEDIKAPECFIIEKKLIELCDIPVFHDDQHGTAIVQAAALLNALSIVNKKINEIKLVCLGAGAAAIAGLKLLLDLGLKKENTWLIDTKGVVYKGRAAVNEYKAEFARPNGTHKTLSDAIVGADVFIGVSGPGLLSKENLMTMAPNPIVFACANPTPEIFPEDAKAARKDVLIATGRSDYPNQVNNVLGFPYIFRGALDVHARKINNEMKIAAVHALAAIARLPVPDDVIQACGATELSFGPDYFIPTPLDHRLLGSLAAAVAKAAVDSGVARKPYPRHYPLMSVDDIFPVS